MNWFRAAILCAAASTAFASEPREVAEAAMNAWTTHDAQTLHLFSHPELISKMRSARIIQYYLEQHPEKSGILRSGSDAEVVALMCEALAAIVPPRDGRFVYEDRYVGTKVADELAIVTFDSSVTSAGSSTKSPSSPTETVLKKKGGKWLFLWSPSVSLHVDLSWDPRP